MACKDAADKRKRRDRERIRLRTEERISRGLCSTCGKGPPEPGHRQCGPCGERRRRVQRAREERRRAAGRPRYTDPEKARARSAERARERARRACRPGAVQEVRSGAIHSGTPTVRGVRRHAASTPARSLRLREGVGQTLRRPRPGEAPRGRAPAQAPAPRRRQSATSAGSVPRRRATPCASRAGWRGGRGNGPRTPRGARRASAPPAALPWPTARRGAAPAPRGRRPRRRRRRAMRRAGGATRGGARSGCVSIAELLRRRRRAASRARARRGRVRASTAGCPSGRRATR